MRFLSACININRSMEKEISRTVSLILPFLYEFKQLKQRFPVLKHLVFIVETVTLLALPIDYSLPVADATLFSFIDYYDSYLLYNKTFLFICTSLFLLFVLLVLLAVIATNLQSSLSGSSKLQPLLRKMKRFLLFSFVALEMTLLPCFVMAAQNVATNLAPDLFVVSLVLLPFNILFIIVGYEKRLLGIYSIPVVLCRIFLSGKWTLLLMGLASLKLAVAEDRQIHKKIVYFLISVWSAIIIGTTSFNLQIDSFYLLIAFVIIPAIFIFSPGLQTFASLLEENDRLIALAEKMMEGQELSLPDKQLINHCVFNFKEELLTAQKSHLQETQKEWLNKFQFNYEKEQMVDFLATKIAFQLHREYSHLLKIQQLFCEVKFSRFTMKTLYEIERLTNEIKQQSSYEQRQKIHELVNLTDRQFLKKEQNINAATIISIQKETEQLHEHFINIAILMQELWTLHGEGHLNDETICRILEKVVEMQSEAEEILRKISKYFNVKNEIAIFDFLKKMNNNNYKPKETSEYEKSKEDLSHNEHLNYILIQQGNILQMSNRLLNECELTKKQAQGYRINDIVNDSIASFLYQRLDRLVQQQIHHQEAHFILPLKTSRDHHYMQPYRATVEILPELINGIKYILHLQKIPQLQITPFFLYSGKKDSIIGTTRNFKRYFNITNDHYLFHSFTNEVFNVDIMSMLNTENNDFGEIICEFRAKRMHTNIGGKLKITQIPVILKKVRLYEVKDENLVLLSIARREEVEKGDKTNLVSEKLPFVNTKDSKERSARDGVDETTFCKIPNPYENLIDEKMSKMDKFYRMSYLKIIILLLAFLLLIFLVSQSVLTLQIDSFSKKIMDNFNNQILKTDKHVNTLVLYSQSCILYQLRTYPEQLLKISPGYNMTALVADYVKKVNKGISTILNEDIVNRISSQPSEVNGGSIYDILENAKKAVATRNISEVVSSWSLMNRIISQQGNTQNNNLDNLTVFFNYYNNIAVILFAAIIFFLEVVSFKIQQVFGKIICLYENIDKAHSQRFVQKYRIFIHELYSSGFFRGVKANSYLRHYKEKSSLPNIEEVGTLCYIEESIGFELQFDRSLNTKRSSEAAIKKRFILSFLSKEFYILIILILFVLFLQIFLYHLNQYKSDFDKILTHSMELHDLRESISYQTSFFMISSLQEILPSASRLSPINNKTRDIFVEVRYQLPPYFQGYLQNESHLLNTNLCNLNLSSEIIYQGINCSSIMGGIMTIGFAEAVIMHRQATQKYSFSNMSQFGNLYRPKAKYPIFMEILYIRRAIYNLVTSLQTTYLGFTVSYIALQNATLASIIKAAWLLLPVFLCISLFFILSQRAKCLICLKSFFILPKDYLLEMRVTKILRQREILNSIQKLAL